MRHQISNSSNSQPLQTPKLHIMQLGFRGFPNVQGGVETHVENLAPKLVALGCDVTAIVRQPYQPDEHGVSWHGVRFVKLWTPAIKSLEALIHTFLGVCYAAWARPDILHIHAVGPSLFTPFARLLGLKVVMTHHGPDYDRQKWGRLAKTILKCGESFGVRYANRCIVISEVIRQLVKDQYQVKSNIIYNGVHLPSLDASTNYLNAFGIQAKRYILIVSRLVPEKRHLDLIKAFLEANLPDYHLVIVGASDHPDAYVKQLLQYGEAHSQIVFTGFQKGETLKSLYTHAALFVLPSSHEGLAISLLEALSYGLSVVASDIPANLTIDLDMMRYFPLGDVETLAQRLRHHIDHPLSEQAQSTIRAHIDEQYNWQHIAQQTLNEYVQVADSKSHRSAT